MAIEIIVAIIGAGGVIGGAIIAAASQVSKEDRILKRIEILERGEKYLALQEIDTKMEGNEPIGKRFERTLRKDVYSLTDDDTRSIPMIIASVVSFVVFLGGLIGGAVLAKAFLAIIGLIALMVFILCIYGYMLSSMNKSIKDNLYTAFAKKVLDPSSSTDHPKGKTVNSSKVETDDGK